jgi:hypothetical protein
MSVHIASVGEASVSAQKDGVEQLVTSKCVLWISLGFNVIEVHIKCMYMCIHLLNYVDE